MVISHHIQYFPTNILTQIFSYLDEDDLCNNIPLVCKKWKMASSKPCLIERKASFIGDKVSARWINHVLHNAELIKSVDLISVDDVVPVLRKICRSNKHIEAITLNNCKSKEGLVPEECLINLLLSLPKLRRIDLSKTNFQSHAFFEMVATHTNITSIDLSLNEFLTVDDLMSLVHNGGILEFKMSRRCKQLVISDQKMAHLIKFMKQNIKLLHLDMTGLGNLTYSEIFSCSKLIDLKLNSAINLTSDLLRKLSTSLSRLQSLKIEGPSMLLKGDVYNLLCTNYTLCQQLLKLKLENLHTLNQTESAGILQVCNNLNALSLKGCKGVTLEAIYSALLSMPNIEFINVAHVGSLDGIRGFLRKKTQLQTLIVDKHAFELNNLSVISKSKLKIIQIP